MFVKLMRNWRFLARLLIAGAFALGVGTTPGNAKSDIENQKVYGDKTIKDLVEKAPAGAVAWKTLQGVYVDVKETKTGTLFIPEFNPAISALDGKIIEIQGFMFPLVPTTDIPGSEDHFLLSSIPASCPFFHIYGGQIIEVVASKKIPFDEENPVRIRGKMTLLKDNTDGLFYKMTAVTLVK
jgi:uncharacterized protein